MRIEVAGPDRFWVWQETRPVLLAKVARWNDGVHYLRLPGYLPVLPPIPATLARTAPEWPHRFASWLTTTPGPLHEGWWSLRPGRPPGPESVLRAELAVDPAGYLDWSAGWNGILTLRPLPTVDDARVKAYRKQAREGVLPPLLLWWISGLDGWLLLDGHTRLAAALSEGFIPPMLELSRAPSPAQIDEQLAHVMRNESVITEQLERDRQAGRPAVDSATRAHQRHFSAVYAAIPADRERTRAWPVRGGVPAWQKIAGTVRPDSKDDDVRDLFSRIHRPRR
jgi:hypothetical protein